MLRALDGRTKKLINWAAGRNQEFGSGIVDKQRAIKVWL